MALHIEGAKADTGVKRDQTFYGDLWGEGDLRGQEV
jgi:hypothetical protein